MPALSVIVSESDSKKLRDDYEKMLALWAQQGRQAPPLPFDHWAGERLMNAGRISQEDIGQMRVFSAIEQLITSMHGHGFCLTHVGGEDRPPEQSAQHLAAALAQHVELPAQYVKRLQDLLAYYQKSPVSLVGNSPGNSPVHSAATIECSYQELVERTTMALDHLETDRAIGRVEGAIALLVSLGITQREAAREMTQAFKAQARGKKKI